MRRPRLGPVLLLALLLPGNVLANWTASGTFRYRDREFDQNGSWRDRNRDSWRDRNRDMRHNANWTRRGR